jgi:methylated-DNA-[protein]-cysteine S-methyltransferase
MDYICHYDSPLGGITLGSDGEALTGLWFDGQKFFGNTLQPQHREADLPVFQETRRWLDVYFSGREPGFTPKIRTRGTPFRMAVWKTLLNIPYGKTMTYGEIAARVAASSEVGRMSAQAVGGAVGHNPISLIIPCHRVLGADGKLTGYAGGLDRKSRLLQMEKTAVFGKSGTFRPQNL